MGVRIAQLFPHSVREITGIGTIVQEISQAVATSGGSSLWIVAGGVGSRALEIPEQTNVIEIRTNAMTLLRNLVLAVGTFLKLLRETPPLSHVHAHAPHLQALAGIIAGKVLGIPVIITFHGVLPFPAGTVRRVLLQWTQRLVLKYASAVTAVSDSTRAALDHGSGIVIRNGARPHQFTNTTRVELRTKWAIEDRLAIIYAGRLAASKGIDLLIRAFALLMKKYPDKFRLILLGQESEEESYRIHDLLVDLNLQGSVIILPRSAEYAKFLWASDVFVLPSFYEGLPMTLLDAMGIGLPCIATSVGGIPELIRNGTDGLLIAPGDDEALFCALQQLAENPSMRQELGASARTRVLSGFSRDAMVAKYLALYDEVEATMRDRTVQALDSLSGPS